jgi:plasmid stabilization system protein ParE
MRIIWSPLSVDRLSEIAEYIARDNPRDAERWIDEIFVIYRIEEKQISILTVRHGKQNLPANDIPV